MLRISGFQMSLNSHLIQELTARIFLLVLFLILEWQEPFHRIIQKEELWLYSNPMTSSYITGTQLWIFIVFPLPFLPLFYHIIVNTKQINSSFMKSDLISSTLATTLLLPLNGVITNIIKLTVGRPRPDFAYRCWPNSGGKPWTTQEDIIFTKREPQDLHCHGDVKKITEGRKSFPSGHSSFSFAVFGFMFLYLSAKLRIYSRKQHVSSFGSVNLNWIWRFLFSVSILLVPICIAISRTCDYHHHWQDVLVGGLLGSTLSCLIYHFHYPPIWSENCDTPKNSMEQYVGQDKVDSSSIMEESSSQLLEVETSI